MREHMAPQNSSGGGKYVDIQCCFDQRRAAAQRHYQCSDITISEESNIAHGGHFKDEKLSFCHSEGLIIKPN